MKRIVVIGILVLFLIGCSSAAETPITDEVVFQGEGKDWVVTYSFNPELYEDKKVNWVELEHKERERSDIDINEINIEFEGRGGTVTGNLGDMKTKWNGNRVSFLIGTVNFETYEEDEFRIVVKESEKKEVITLRK
ncbi:hypothetical protein [Ornithinibacillus halotolerans]|uniref:Uncharacterized protein n=1 Tax=Ornithinibacillus halotolerans TaxID=1274357 RepID=A0A916W291_9BACI|nr:hypothetical protein [Ornithinibacillus halotolerans]GGA60374.1 hypothetical protein GCM10008025_00490 [Ornithinibacillus halotolerans]